MKGVVVIGCRNEEAVGGDDGLAYISVVYRVYSSWDCFCGKVAKV